MGPKADGKAKKAKSLTIAPGEDGGHSRGEGFVNFHEEEGMTYEANGKQYHLEYKRRPDSEVLAEEERRQKQRKEAGGGARGYEPRGGSEFPPCGVSRRWEA